MKWYQDDKGNTSMMRILALPASVVGMITTLCGVAGMFLNRPGAGTAITAGAGIIATVFGAKAWQKLSERG